MIIYKIESQDAEEFVNLLLQLDNETKFMLFEPEERKITVDDMESRLSNSNDSKGICIGAKDEDKLIGFISVNRGNSKRSEHTAYIAIGIIQKYVNKGIGKLLFEEIENWALTYGINRLELTVLTHNEIAIRLYEKIGFKKEGIREKSMMLGKRTKNILF